MYANSWISESTFYSNYAKIFTKTIKGDNKDKEYRSNNPT
jgi:hypothetical protein